MLKLDFTQNHILEDDRVKLFPLEMEHVDELLSIANEDGIWDYSFIKGNGREALSRYIQSTVEARAAGREYSFAVYDKKYEAFAGSTRFYEIIPALQSLRLGYTWYGKRFRGTDLNKHCKFLLFRFAFEGLNAERIGLGAYCENLRSIKAMESVGCVKEGVFRSLLPSPTGNGRTDAVLYSMLKTEWLSEKKIQLKNKLT